MLFFLMDDAYFMRRALRLAAKAAGATSPNPMVGAVLVKDGKIIAGDYHRKAGTPHAEALVLAKAGKDAKGATLYVTLEPCVHTDKRTPPCTRAIIESGVGRVIASMTDPNPKVSGKGFHALREAGIKVETGILEKNSMILNESYVKFIKTGLPFVMLKAAMTLDGKIATPDGQSKWITGEKARRMVHKTRCRVDAVLTAIGTVSADDPELTARLPGCKKQPLRVVIDPELKISPDAKILRRPPETIIVTKNTGEKYNKLTNSGISIIIFQGKLELVWLLKKLATLGVTSVLIEGGSSLNAHAFHEGIVDKVMFFTAPKILCGKDSYSVVGGDALKCLNDACRIKNVKVRSIGEDLLIEGYVDK